MKKNIQLITLWLLAIFVFTTCSDSKKSITKLDDLKNVSIGAMTGTTGEQLAKAKFPQATVKCFDDIMDAIAALKSNQLDAVITGFPAAMNVCKHNADLYYLEEPVDYENTAVAARKDSEKLLADVNKIIGELLSDGTLKDMRRRWFKKDLLPYEEIDIQLPLKGKVLKVATSATREPFCYVDANRKITGHDGELARRIASKLNRPIEFVDMKFSALIPALQSGKADLIIAGMTATPERMKSVNFSQSYFQNSQVILTKRSFEKESETVASSLKLKSHNDLVGKNIGVLLGSIHDTYALKKYPNSKILQYKSPSDLLVAVKSGKVDAAIFTSETVKEIIRTDKELKILGDTLFTVPIAMGFNKTNDALKEKFNSFLRQVKADGTFNDMVSRWMVEGKIEMPVIKNSKRNGTILVGTVSDKGLPFTIVKDNKMVGFDTELAERFAAYLGKELKFVDMEFGSLIISAVSNKIDMITSTLMITEERKKQIDFSDEYLRLGASVFALAKNIEEVNTGTIKTLDDIADKVVGTVHDAFVANKYPNAVLKRFNSTADMILSLNTQKIDVAFFDVYSAKVLLKTNPGIGILTEDALSLPLGYGFSKKNPSLKNKFNKFLATVKSNGTFENIYKKWFIEDPVKATMPKFNFKPNASQIILGVSVGDLPYSAYVNNQYAGFDIELLNTFALSEGYKLKIITMDFSALVASLAAGKVDMIADGICITEERAKQVDFSDKYLDFKTAVIALNKNLAGANTTEGSSNSTNVLPTTSFIQDVAESFHNNIIIENRYLLILDGLKTTALISILSTIFGTLLGGLICFMRMSKKKIFSVIAKVYISILRGTPVLVILMIIFYVVFASVDIDPVIVAVIAFGLNFAAYVSEMYRTGIEGVDKGQTEAGIAMGFSKVKTFIYIILPQAVRRILPVYKGEVISLVKMTSIVGYIAVQDLTKASDIIRSRTFDAFFPLIMVAVLYFIIAWLLMFFLGYVERVTNPKLKIKRGL